MAHRLLYFEGRLAEVRVLKLPRPGRRLYHLEELRLRDRHAAEDRSPERTFR